MKMTPLLVLAMIVAGAGMACSLLCCISMSRRPRALWEVVVKGPAARRELFTAWEWRLRTASLHSFWVIVLLFIASALFD